MIPWHYNGKPVDKHPEDAVAFVYLLIFEDGSSYIGKKSLVSTRRKKLAGKTRRTVTKSESNWKSYLSSSDEVKFRIKVGEKLVTREILRWCRTLAEATYWELYEQMVRHVLLSDNWLNKWVAVRLYKSSLKGLQNDSMVT